MDLGPTVFFGTNCSNSSAERYISSPPQGFFVFTDSTVASCLHHWRLCNAIGSTVRWLRRHHCRFYCCSRFILYPIGFPFRWTSITLSYSQTEVFLIGNIKSFSLLSIVCCLGLLLQVVVDIQINSDHIEMYADWTSKGNVLDIEFAQIMLFEFWYCQWYKRCVVGWWCLI